MLKTLDWFSKQFDWFLFLLATTHKTTGSFVKIIDYFCQSKKTKENKAFSNPLKNTECNSIDCHDKPTGWKLVVVTKLWTQAFSTDWKHKTID